MIVTFCDCENISQDLLFGECRRIHSGPKVRHYDDFVEYIRCSGCKKERELMLRDNQKEVKN